MSKALKCNASFRPATREFANGEDLNENKLDFSLIPSRVRSRLLFPAKTVTLDTQDRYRESYLTVSSRFFRKGHLHEY